MDESLARFAIWNNLEFIIAVANNRDLFATI